MDSRLTRVRIGTRTVWQINRVETSFLFDEIFRRDAYGLLTRPALAPGALVVDVGANIGLFGSYILEHQPAVRLVCIEPAPLCFEALRLNLIGSNQLHLLQAAAGATSGLVTLFFHPRYTMTSSLDPDCSLVAEAMASWSPVSLREATEVQRAEFAEVLPDIIRRRLEHVPIIVPVRRLDDLLTTCGAVGRIDLLKVDVEGAEVAVLEGLGRRGWDVHSAVVEAQGAENVAAVERLLANWGMAVSTRQASEMTGSQIYLVIGEREDPLGMGASR